MNKYDERYDIRLAKKNDISLIMQFLDEHWKNGHILSKNRELFEYEFLEGDNVNFVIAIDRNTNTLEAISGFLRCSMIDDINEKDLWGSIWKVNDATNNMSFLGVELIRRLRELVPHRFHLGIGINPNTTLPIRKLVFREKTQKMKHYYMVNSSLDEYKLAIVNEIPSNDKIIKSNRFSVRRFNCFEEYDSDFKLENIVMIPQKDNWYIRKRFFEHPIYKYDVCGIYDGEKCVAVVIYRINECNGSKCIRVVDFLGEYSTLAELGVYFSALLRESNAEYIDFYNVGIEKEIFEHAGFIERIDDTNIIPNYFGPFVQENIDIWVRAEAESAVFFKGDGDQDRPN